MATVKVELIMTDNASSEMVELRAEYLSSKSLAKEIKSKVGWVSNINPAAIAAASYSRDAKAGRGVAEIGLEITKAPEDAFGESCGLLKEGAGELDVLVGIGPVEI